MRDGDIRGGEEEGMNTVVQAMKRGVKRMEYRSEDEKEQRESDEGNVDPETEIEDNRECLPEGKRRKMETMGEGWETVSPIKWKQSPLSGGEEEKGRKVLGHSPRQTII